MEDNYAGEFGEAWKGVGALWSGWLIKELCGALGEVCVVFKCFTLQNTLKTPYLLPGLFLATSANFSSPLFSLL